MTTRYWNGASGASYGFHLYPKGTEFLPLSAVYMLCRGFTENGFVKYGALYVGEAESLFDRLNTDVAAGRHDGYKRAQANGLTHIGIHFIASEADRMRIEKDIRHGVNPICNREPVPPGIGIFSRRY